MTCGLNRAPSTATPALPAAARAPVASRAISVRAGSSRSRPVQSTRAGRRSGTHRRRPAPSRTPYAAWPRARAAPPGRRATAPVPRPGRPASRAAARAAPSGSPRRRAARSRKSSRWSRTSSGGTHRHEHPHARRLARRSAGRVDPCASRRGTSSAGVRRARKPSTRAGSRTPYGPWMPTCWACRRSTATSRVPATSTSRPSPPRRWARGTGCSRPPSPGRPTPGAAATGREAADVPTYGVAFLSRYRVDGLGRRPAATRDPAGALPVARATLRPSLVRDEPRVAIVAEVGGSPRSAPGGDDAPVVPAHLERHAAPVAASAGWPSAPAGSC